MVMSKTYPVHYIVKTHLDEIGLIKYFSWEIRTRSAKIISVLKIETKTNAIKSIKFHAEKFLNHQIEPAEMRVEKVPHGKE